MFHVEVWDGKSWVRIGEGHSTYALARQWLRKNTFSRPTHIVRGESVVVGPEFGGPREPLERAS